MPNVRGSLCITPASTVVCSDMDYDACGAQTPSECNASKTSSTLMHCQHLPASPALTSVDMHRHGCDESLRQPCPKHTGALVACDACQRYLSEAIQTGSCKGASHSNSQAPGVSSTSSNVGVSVTGSTGRRRSRRAAAQHLPNYAEASDSDTDRDGDGEPNHVHGSLAADLEENGDEAAGEDERPRKRCRPYFHHREGDALRL
jgi:hypothetical protein